MRKKTHPNDSPKVRSSYPSFAELKRHLEEAPASKITMCMDKHLLDGGTLGELMGKVAQDNRRLGSNDFKSESRIKAHIEHRRRKGWIIEENENKEFKLVGYRNDADQNLKSAHMSRKSP